MKAISEKLMANRHGRDERALAALSRVSSLFSRFSVLPPLFAITYNAIIRPRIFRATSRRSFFFPPLLFVPATRPSYNTSPPHFREAQPFRRGVVASIKKKLGGSWCARIADHLELKFLRPRKKRRLKCRRSREVISISLHNF